MDTAMVTLDRRVINNQARQAMIEGADLEYLAEENLRDQDGEQAAVYAALATMKYTKAMALKQVGPS
jgi:hypothetical protein